MFFSEIKTNNVFQTSGWDRLQKMEHMLFLERNQTCLRSFFKLQRNQGTFTFS